MNQDLNLTTKTKITIIIQWIVMAILVMVMFTKCKQNSEESLRLTNNEKIANDSIIYFKNKINTLTASVGTYQLTQSEFEARFLQKDQKLKKITEEFNKLQSVLKFKAKASIDTVFIPFNFPIEKSDSTSEYVTKKKDWFSFEYKIDTAGIKLKNITSTIEVVAVTGFKKNWFLGRKTAITDVTSSTKGVVIQNLSSAQIVVPKAFYETNIFLIATGFFIKSLLPIK